MTQLLISVRNATEAKLIPLHRVGVVDVKEPNRGGLGKADYQTMMEVTSQIGKQAPLSVALGELVECDPNEMEKLPHVEFAKFGLSQMADVDDWKSLWRSRNEQLPGITKPVAVIYADWDSCRAPAPESILDAAMELQCGAVLIDTFDKTAGNVFAQMKWQELDRLCQRTQSAGMKFVLAGGITTAEELSLALEMSPDLIGVRGAICDRERTGSIDPESLRTFLEQFFELAKKARTAITG